ncbi:TlpA disulfide reductase family protein [Pedobacter gandavensis]|uniref:TlpA disulfide reductase family protein n=1 Tax=Pedobacter gandavensis TaxID=2679963 RepID=UPI00292CBA11|nr:TlpA disulfide reductase family protein [Pedobacter gandavensis]
MVKFFNGINVCWSVLFWLMSTATTAQIPMEKNITIIGHVKGDTKLYPRIYYYSKQVKLDSVEIVRGQFKITLPYQDRTTWFFYTQYERKTRKSYRPFPLLIDQPGTIKMDFNIEQGFYSSKLKGNKTSVLYADFFTKREELYALSKSKGPGIRDSARKAWVAQWCDDFVAKNANEFVSAYVLSTTGKSAMTLGQLEKSFVDLSPVLQQTNEGLSVAAFIRGMRQTGIGKPVKSFVLNDPEGKAVDFAQFKGKYVWVDFWASWCGPCKKSFPYMRGLYEKYRGPQFEILGISADATIDPWLKILEQIKNPWPQVWDSGNIASEFTVTAYPTSFLIDPEGRIILKEVGFEPNGPIERKLKEIFGK